MRVLDFLKKRVEVFSLLASGLGPQSVLAPARPGLPEDAKYKIGEIVHAAGSGIPLGDFTVLDIKAGGYAIVYIVVVKETMTFYAIKTFQDWCFEKPGVVERFVREAETWIRLGKHPNVVYAHSVFTLHGRPHILLEYVVGSRLWDKVKHGPLPVPTALKYAIQFCRGMSHARSRIPGFIHRDIKPPNCLVTTNDVLKITDFGNIKHSSELPETTEIFLPDKPSGKPANVVETPSGHWGVGTPIYMAPEQFNTSHGTDARSDVYSFGVMLFEMLTGGRPFEGDNYEECYYQHRHTVPPDPASLNPEVPRPLAELVLNCLAKSPAERPNDFTVLESKLSALLSEIGGEELPHALPEELTREELLNQGMALMSLDRCEEALTRYDQVLAGRPKLARAWNLKGEALARLGRDEEALACFDRALARDRKLILAWGNKGRTLSETGRHEEALACFERALALDSRLTFVWDSKGLALTVLGRPDEAVACFERALALDPRYVEAYNHLGMAYHRLGRHTEAIEAYGKAIRLNPRDVDARNNLSNSYLDSERFQEAVESCEAVINFRPDCREARAKLEHAQNSLRRQEEAAREILETDKRLSESLLWRLQEDYYDRKGISAWDQIPYYPTSNPFFAEAYAELIVAFLSDYRPYLKADEPVYIIEMATGTGCFSFYLLRALAAKVKYFNDFKRLKIRYVMTDFTESNIKHWESHEELRPFRDAGTLDFAVWRPEDEEAIFLRASRSRLCAGAIKNPVIAIANYFFDSIRQDLFRITDRKLQEVRLTFYRDTREVQPGDPVICGQLNTLESHVEVNENYYPDPKLNAILRYYTKSLTDASILFPLGAFDCIRNLQSLSGNNLVLLSSDKGATNLEFMEGHQEHTYALHDSVFSYMVNYHAISRYFEDQGGCSFFTTDKTHHIATTMNVLLSQTAIELTNSRYTFAEKVKKQNLINHLYDCEHLLSSKSRNRVKTMLRSCMAFLRLSNFDPTVLTLCGNKICEALAEINEYEKEALVEILANVRSNIYMADREYNAFYWLGKMYYGLKLYDECLDAFHQSVKLFGPDDDALYYIAACHELKGDYEVALDFYKRKLISDPGCPLTQSGIERTESGLAAALHL